MPKVESATYISSTLIPATLLLSFLPIFNLSTPIIHNLSGSFENLLALYQNVSVFTSHLHQKLCNSCRLC